MDHVAEWDVVEADVRDGVVRGEFVERVKGADGEEVLGAEDGARGVGCEQ